MNPSLNRAFLQKLQPALLKSSVMAVEGGFLSSEAKISSVSHFQPEATHPEERSLWLRDNPPQGRGEDKCLGITYRNSGRISQLWPLEQTFPGCWNSQPGALSEDHLGTDAMKPTDESASSLQPGEAAPMDHRLRRAPGPAHQS